MKQFYSFVVFVLFNVIANGNNIQVITKELDLHGESMTIERGSTLIIDEGSINNGTIVLLSDCTVQGKTKKDLNEIVFVIKGQNITIENINWNNSNTNALVSYNNCSGLKISRCNVVANKENCVKLVADNVNGVIENVSIVNSSFVYNRMGIEIQNHGNDSYKYKGVNINECSFSMLNKTHKLGYAVSLSGYGSHVEIKDCNFNNTNVGVELVGFSDVDIFANSFDNIKDCIIRSSNFRPMTDVRIHDNTANSPYAKLFLSNTSKSSVSHNSFDIKNIEMKGCNDFEINGNELLCNGHYAVILDGDTKETKGNRIEDNRIVHKGKRWASIRCYGRYCRNNMSINNDITVVEKSGKRFDQINGALHNDLK